MPFTTIALDRLIELKASKPMAAGKYVTNSKQGNTTDRQPDSNTVTKTRERKNHWTQISPALYATPEPTPLPELPDSPSSFTSSPYIVNHKRRGPRLSKAFSEDDVALHRALSDEKTNQIVRSFEAEDVGSCSIVNGCDAKFVVNGEVGNDDISTSAPAGEGKLEREREMDDFFDPQDSLSARSSIDGENGSGLDRSVNLNSSVSEFYDAWEELSSESGSQPSSHNTETELRELRLSLLVEIEKRKQAEECINNIRSQWGKIHKQLSLVGLNVPEDPTMLEDQSENDLCNQIHLIRFVSNCIGRGVAKAETEAEMEAQLECKKFEIGRLLDKVRYYEAVNHEMSQRNQETVETMRRVRQRRQRWIWGSIIGAGVAVGSVALIWSYTDRSTSGASEGGNDILKKA